MQPGPVDDLPALPRARPPRPPAVEFAHLHACTRYNLLAEERGPFAPRIDTEMPRCVYRISSPRGHASQTRKVAGVTSRGVDGAGRHRSHPGRADGAPAMAPLLGRLAHAQLRGNARAAGPGWLMSLSWRTSTRATWTTGRPADGRLLRHPAGAPPTARFKAATVGADHRRAPQPVLRPDPGRRRAQLGGAVLAAPDGAGAHRPGELPHRPPEGAERFPVQIGFLWRFCVGARCAPKRCPTSASVVRGGYVVG